MNGGFPHPDLSGYVLAGGASSRMGRDKALLPVGGRTLIETAVLKLKEVCCDVAILSGGNSDETRLNALQKIARTVPEAGLYEGPAAGLAAALADARTPWTLVLAVDQPYLPAELLQRWFLAAQVSGAQVSFLVPGSNLQPIPVLVQTHLHTLVVRGIEAGERKLRSILDGAALAGPQGKVHRFHVEDTPATQKWFRNLNSPSDLPISTEQIFPTDTAR